VSSEAPACPSASIAQCPFAACWLLAVLVVSSLTLAATKLPQLLVAGHAGCALF